MKETPFMQLGLRVERSTYFQFKKIVKDAKTTNSKYLREMLNRELSGPEIYDKTLTDFGQVESSHVNNSSL